MLPPNHKTKLPRFLAWPIGFAALECQLDDCPQMKEARVSFFGGSLNRFVADSEERQRPYSVLEVRLDKRFSSRDEGWEMWIRPVPREVKAKIKQLLNDEGLPSVRNWLMSTPSLDLKAVTTYLRFSVLYDEALETLV